jgi:hypothetical protein
VLEGIGGYTGSGGQRQLLTLDGLRYDGLGCAPRSVAARRDGRPFWPAQFPVVAEPLGAVTIRTARCAADRPQSSRVRSSGAEGKAFARELPPLLLRLVNVHENPGCVPFRGESKSSHAAVRNKSGNTTVISRGSFVCFYLRARPATLGR